MASKTYPLTWGDDGQRERWQKAADEAGMTLAAWIRETCEMRLKGLLVVAAEAALPDGALSKTGEIDHAARARATGAKVFRGMDPKGGSKK